MNIDEDLHIVACVFIHCKVNPFRDRIVTVFSSRGDGSLTFEDFLDMMSVFSGKSPREVKVENAFRIYCYTNLLKYRIYLAHLSILM